MTIRTWNRPFAAGGIIAVGLMALSLTAQAVESHNMRLVGVNDLQARSAYQPIIQEQAAGHIAYIGHHAGPRVGGVRQPVFNPLTGTLEQNGVSIVDVTDPANPVLVHHLPANGTTADGNPNSGSQMVQTCNGEDLDPSLAGKTFLLRANGSISHQIYDVTDPSDPQFVSTVVEVGESGGSVNTHKNWWDCDSGIAYLVSTVDGWRVRRVMQVFDLSDPENPVFIRNFGLVGQEPVPGKKKKGEDPPPPPGGSGLHEAIQFGDRLYLAYGTGSNGILQIVDRQKLLTGDPAPTEANLLFPQIGRLDMPPFWGGHTALPQIGINVAEHESWPDFGSPADFVVLVTESLRNECGLTNRRESKPHMAFMVDITDPTKPFPVANYQVPESEGAFCERGGRFGAHATNWSFNPAFLKKLVVISWFNAGARVVDIRDPYNPVEVAFFIPSTTANTDERCTTTGVVETCKVAIQTNNVEIDDRNLIYLADRANTGLHIVELTGSAKQILDGD